MFGRMDLESTTCLDCHGSGKDPRKRKRKCPRCDGSGSIARCRTCGHLMPCPGTLENVLDQGYCHTQNKDAPSTKGHDEN